MAPGNDGSGGSTPPAFELQLPAAASQLWRLRAALREWLGRCGVPERDQVDITLAVHEASANVVEHAYPKNGGELVVTGAWDSGAVTIDVRDRGRWLVQDRREHQGWGLLAIGKLVDQVEIDTDATGTVVTVRRRIAGVDTGEAARS